VKPDRMQPGVRKKVLKRASSRRVVGPGGVEVFLKSCEEAHKDLSNGIGRASRGSAADVVVQDGGDVALPEIADDGNNELTGVLRALGQLKGSPDDGAG
jgi:hypothetical protein